MAIIIETESKEFPSNGKNFRWKVNFSNCTYDKTSTLYCSSFSVENVYFIVPYYRTLYN